VIAEATKVLHAIEDATQARFELTEDLVGAAIEFRHHVGAQVVAHHLGVPGVAVQHPLDASLGTRGVLVE
jgi:hypothetical protein